MHASVSGVGAHDQLPATHLLALNHSYTLSGELRSRDPGRPTTAARSSMISIKPEACPTLRTITADEIPAAFFEPVDPKAREQALAIVNDVKANGVEGLLKYACKLGDLPEGERKYSVSKEELKAAYDASDPELLQKLLHFVRQGLRDAVPGTPGYVDERLDVFRRAFAHFIGAFGAHAPLLRVDHAQPAPPQQPERPGEG